VPGHYTTPGYFGRSAVVRAGTYVMTRTPARRDERKVRTEQAVFLTVSPRKTLLFGSPSISRGDENG